eukprot:s367_g5.t1
MAVSCILLAYQCKAASGMQLIQAFGKDLARVFSGRSFSLEPFGSYVTDLGLPPTGAGSRSDLDVVVLFRNHRADSFEASRTPQITLRVVFGRVKLIFSWSARRALKLQPRALRRSSTPDTWPPCPQGAPSRRSPIDWSVCSAVVPLGRFGRAAVLSWQASTFVGLRPTTARPTPTTRAAGQYADLSDLEDRILESCLIKDLDPQAVDSFEDVDEELECMDVYGRLVEAHFKAQEECDLDSGACDLLRLLDRLAWGSSGDDGLELLRQMQNSIQAFYHVFHSGHEAFASFDLDADGKVTEEEFRTALRRMNPDISASTCGRLFRAADMNLDSFIDASEFSNFLNLGCTWLLKIGAMTLDPLKELLPEHRREVSSADLVQWAMRHNLQAGQSEHATGRTSGSRVAVKCIDLGSLTPKERHQASQEAYLLRRVKHPHIVRFFDCIVGAQQMHIVMQLMEGGDLASVIRRCRDGGQRPSEASIWRWLLQMARALAYLHKASA